MHADVDADADIELAGLKVRVVVMIANVQRIGTRNGERDVM